MQPLVNWDLTDEGKTVIMKICDNEIEFKTTQFDYVNRDAKVVLVGITPGNRQLIGNRNGKPPREIKRENAFAGAMRTTLIKMLDRNRSE